MNTQILNEQLNLPPSIRSASAELAVGVLAAGLVATPIGLSGARIEPFIWLLAAALVYGSRLVLRQRNRIADADSSPSRSLPFGLLASGLCWGLAAIGVASLYGVGWMLGIVTAAVTILSVLVLTFYRERRSYVLAFASVAIVPFSVSVAFLPGVEAKIFAASGLAFFCALIVAANALQHAMQEFRAVQREIEQQAARAGQAEQAIKRFEVEIKTTQEQRQQLQHELQDATANLKITAGKADALSASLERVSPYDNETGLLNAKIYLNVIGREWARMLRQELPITVVHMRIDNLDDFADTYGKVAYENVIRRVAELTKSTGTRPGDVVVRLEENKFALLLPEADHKNGETLADVLRQQIRRLDIGNSASTMHAVITASFGVATVIPNSDLTIEEFNRRADDALYEAQFQGGDKVVRFRTLHSIKLERWDSATEGELTADGLLHKLAVLGYEAHKRTLGPGECETDKRVPIDKIDAIIEGKLKVTLEGESRVLHPGDCLFVPKGLVTSLEVVGDKAVICLEATRS